MEGGPADFFPLLIILSRHSSVASDTIFVPHSFASLSSHDQNTFILADPRHFTQRPSGFLACKGDMTANVNSICRYL